MRRFALLVCVVATAAIAGERWLGNTLATDGGWANNHFTASQFAVGSGSLVSVQCDQDSFVMVNVPIADAGTSLKLSAGQLLTSSCSAGGTLYSKVVWSGPVDAGGGATVDGGWYDGGVFTDCLLASASANFPFDAGSSLCHWYQRQGNEGP